MTATQSARRTVGFDYTAYMRQVCASVVLALPEFAHVDLARVAVGFCQARNRTRYGMHASLTPLRFAGGGTESVRRGRRVTLQRVLDERGAEMLYVLNFYLPRFHDESFLEKVTTVVHELWHISPEFNGDIRRHPGRCYAHSHSKEKYDGEMRRLAERYLATAPGADLLAPLQLGFGELREQHGRIFGARVPRPRIIPLV